MHVSWLRISFGRTERGGKNLHSGPWDQPEGTETVKSEMALCSSELPSLTRIEGNFKRR